MNIPNIKITLLKLIVLSLPFSGWSIIDIPYTGITFLLIYLYFIFSFACYKYSISTEILFKMVLPLGMVWLIMLFMTYYHFTPGSSNAGSILRLYLFYLLLFVFGVKDAIVMHLKGESLIPWFLFSVIVTAAIFVLNLDPGTDTEGRKTVMGLNPNALGQFGAFATLMAVDMLVRKPDYALNGKLLLVMFPVFVYMVAGTGSRGAVISSLGGLVLYFVLIRGKMHIHPLMLFFIILMGTLTAYYMLTSQLVSGRMNEMEDDYRLRVLWPAGMEIFKSYPIFGTGAALFETEMKNAMGQYRPLHNEFFTVLTYTGLTGLAFFLLFFKKLYNLTAEWRTQANNVLPLTVLLVLMFHLFKAGGGLVQVYVWVIFIMLSIPFQSIKSPVSTNENGRYK
jgi:hypothetical protein